MDDTPTVKNPQSNYPPPAVNVMGAAYTPRDALSESDRMSANAREHAETIRVLTEHNVTLLATVSAQRATIAELQAQLATRPATRPCATCSA